MFINIRRVERIFDSRYDTKFVVDFLTLLVLTLFIICLLLPKSLTRVFVIPAGEEIGKSLFVLLAHKRYRKYFMPLALATGIGYAIIEILIRGGSQNLMIAGLVIHPLLAITTTSFYKNGNYTMAGYASGILVASSLHGMVNWMLNW